MHTGDLILVNNWTPYRFPEEQELACIFDSKNASYYVRDREVYLAPRAHSPVPWYSPLVIRSTQGSFSRYH